jgi:hypothetical protein
MKWKSPALPTVAELGPDQVSVAPSPVCFVHGSIFAPPGQRAAFLLFKIRRKVQLVAECHIRVGFTGWRHGNIYELTNGQSWQQVSPEYCFRILTRPLAKVWQEGSNYFLEVQEMPIKIKVRQVKR